ncbi:MAG TPA: homoserine kinase [Dictyoglomaceae bacterium]|nr:homoserine kinase [Dictyoglomaceae bacterium]HOL38967.1 homoserine kinase [Dictyoglomaceae bacterium]HOP94845.1 homoserine kinase [Dictyoglomaceae bacterium]HPP15616.1 homoserine kinase [Dictyoglomaceae bacterium]HPU43517.1 homoserine kinase [Dictyoglomaceae bacterium]
MNYCVKVPATSANLGPGFDTLGIAWDLFLKIVIRTNVEGEKIINDNIFSMHNLFSQSFNLTLEYLKEKPKNYRIEVSSDIPVGKGLGSSAAAILGGVFSAEIVTGKNLSKEEKIELALSLEGHLDNLSAALEGGITICTKNEETIFIKKIPINGEILGVIYIPNYQFPTTEARKVLPTVYPREKVVYNLQKLSFLLIGLIEREEKILNLGLDDAIHEPYRCPLVKEYTLISEELKKWNKKVVLSGAGPSLLSIFFNREEALEIFEKLKNNLKNKVEGDFKILNINHQGVKIERI